jgi:hypothetical protein
MTMDWQGNWDRINAFWNRQTDARAVLSVLGLENQWGAVREAFGRRVLSS